MYIRRATTITSIAIGFALERQYSDVDNIASDYLTSVLAFKHLTRAHGISLEKPLESVVAAGQHKMHKRVTWSLRKHSLLDRLQGMDSDATYRLEWMAAQLTNMTAKLAKTPMNFDAQCRLLFDTQIDSAYLDLSRTAAQHRELERLLPIDPAVPGAPLHERFLAYREQFLIPKTSYEPFFRRLFDDCVRRMVEKVPELAHTRVTQKYIDDPTQCFEATCEAAGHDQSTMLVNLARPITYDKAQQLAMHELTHHMQFMLMEQHLYRFPEMRATLEDGPMGMLMEGGAEVAVDLFLPPAARQQDLTERLPGPLKQHASHLLAVENLTWSGLWSASISIAKQLVDGELSPEQARHAMLAVALKPDNSWPNVVFFQEYGAYTQSYGWGKQLILDYLRTQTQHATLLDAYVAFAKRPPTPSKMRAVIQAASQCTGDGQPFKL